MWKNLAIKLFSWTAWRYLALLVFGPPSARKALFGAETV
jgi:hypothetical protein